MKYRCSWIPRGVVEGMVSCTAVSYLHDMCMKCCRKSESTVKSKWIIKGKEAALSVASTLWLRLEVLQNASDTPLMLFRNQ